MRRRTSLTAEDIRAIMPRQLNFYEKIEKDIRERALNGSYSLTTSMMTYACPVDTESHFCSLGYVVDKYCVNGFRLDGFKVRISWKE